MDLSLAGSALAFIAFGANLAGTGALLLFNPHDRVVRWYALFSAFMLAWLALQGALLMGAVGEQGNWWYGVVVHMLPVAFTTVTFVQVFGVRDRWGLLLLTVALFVIVFVIREPFEWRYQLFWHSIGWGTGAVLYVLHGRTRERSVRTTGRRALDYTLNLLVPAGVIGAILMRENFIVFGLPALTIVTVFLLFVGVVYHRYYNIEVRAVRSGEIGVRAAEQERLALLGELSASIAHEVRNPLTGLRSLAQQLRDDRVDEEKRGRYLSVILDEIARLDRIVANLLDVARRPAAQSSPEVIDLGTLFADLELLVESRARTADVRIHSDARGLSANTHRSALAQVLLNLLLNAIAHSPAGSRVDVTAQRSNGMVALLVSDAGPGIPHAERDRIFEPFHTAGGGTGLGLAVVRTLAREHDWKVEVDDTPGGGAQFRVSIPVGQP